MVKHDIKLTKKEYDALLEFKELYKDKAYESQSLGLYISALVFGIVTGMIVCILMGWV